ncbi:hypothetical protein Asp14428_11650 [Actinoplanes sp. NBRC 14428]|uniref:Peptidase inhibitor family I36 n=1 Tax=Pseudosporangium ferrugineum TaxID=439699 RepID=A0A2T0SF88_9ACTN|nr:hypothetical protein [Pseudosporangium ferrugineum]PRY32071.1 hypothetical protein CLV70_102282 [Pseudosporangium ferrugineum]BCJ49690.1 hypothetical protein Asp14428_11650 [Actinoplanes sp. NBRC 14428]
MKETIIRNAKRWGVALAALAVVAAPAQVANASAGDTASRSAFAEQARAAGLDQRQARQLQGEVDRILAGMKTGGRQVSANEVRSADGRVRAVVPVPGEQRARPLSGAGTMANCSYEYLCLFDRPNFSGVLFNLYYCDFINLGDYGLNDRLESYDNSQTAGTTAGFYNWEGSWKWKFGSTAPHTDYNLNRWSGLANMIDAVDPC